MPAHSILFGVLFVCHTYDECVIHVASVLRKLGKQRSGRGKINFRVMYRSQRCHEYSLKNETIVQLQSRDKIHMNINETYPKRTNLKFKKTIWFSTQYLQLNK